MIKSDVLILANKLAPVIGDRSQAMRQAWSIIKMLRDMRQGVVDFKFVKADGTERLAQGTLNPVIMQLPPKGKSQPISICIPYFDVARNHFRSFRADRYLGKVA